MNRDAAVYAGTFDPVTLGHVDLVRRGAALFARVVVCVSEEGRATLFPAAERIAFVKEAVRDLPNVEVVGFAGLLVAEARRHGARVLLRGVRGAKDLDTEMPMAVANRTLAPEIETLLLPAAPGLALVSSSLVREVAALGGDASAWVPPVVAAALARKRISPRYPAGHPSS
jgi:pantetheine-phosphate adenylyltransferase